MSSRKYWLTLALVVLAGSVVSLVAAEIVMYSGDGDVPKAGRLSGAIAGKIAVDGIAVISLPGGGGGVPLSVRAEILDTRMTEVLCRPPAPVTIGEIRGKPTLYVGDLRLITVYPEDAAARGTRMQELAQQWAAQVRAAISRCHPQLGPSAEDEGRANP